MTRTVAVATALLLVFVTKTNSSTAADTCPSQLYPVALMNPCSPEMSVKSPKEFHILFDTNYGGFSAACRRARAPVWVDRIYNLALNGYYNDNYFFRVIPGKYVQFGTNGYPNISNCYNYASPQLAPCGVLQPQPDQMPVNAGDIPGLSNVFGTLSMSTSYNESTKTTWNATAELFINLGNNSQLDAMLFVPVCTISPTDMAEVVLNFPSFGEVQELGGDGVSLEMLYSEGNGYIESNSSWDSMAESSTVRISCSAAAGRCNFNSTCGPCTTQGSSKDEGQPVRAARAMPYEQFDSADSRWICPRGLEDTCSRGELHEPPELT